jgi:hypothetical protein
VRVLFADREVGQRAVVLVLGEELVDAAQQFGLGAGVVLGEAALPDQEAARS